MDQYYKLETYPFSTCGHLLSIFVSLAVAMESAGFMNALTIAASAAPVRKRKRVSTASKVLTCTSSMWYFPFIESSHSETVLLF